MSGIKARDSAGQMTFVVATTNMYKYKEIEAALGRYYSLRKLPPTSTDVDESGGSLRANARLKAEAAYALAPTPTLADDTGFYVNALNGRPGALAARFAHRQGSYEAAMVEILRRLRDTPDEERTARFTTCALAYLSNSKCLVAYGSLHGRIVRPRGTGGFGYDAMFEPEGSGGRTFAELDEEERLAMSHRTKAFLRLARLIEPPSDLVES